MIPEGTYLAHPMSMDWGESNNGNIQCEIEFEIIEGEQTGQRITAFLYFTPKTEKHSRESLAYCGCTMPGGDVTSLDGFGAKDVRIVVKHDEYEGKVRAKVKWINSLERVSARPAGADKLSEFRERMRGAVLESQRNRPAKKADDVPW